jgi:hypothetical protein
MGLLSDTYMQHFGKNRLRYVILTVALLGSPAVLLIILADRQAR